MWKRALTTGGIVLGGTGIYLQNSERLKSYTQQNKSFDMYAYSELSFVNSKTEETPEELRKCNGSIIFTQTNPDNCIVGYDVRGLPNKEHQIFVGDVKVGQLSTKNSDGSFVGQVLNHQTKLFGSKSVIGKSVEVSEKDGKKTISVGKVQPFPIYATCTVTPQGKPCSGDDKNNDCQGIIKLKQVDPYNCHISYEVKGLSAGKHGFHIHEKADFSNGCISAGPHYNPFNKNHGATEDSDRHVGDLGNIEPESNGIATGTIVDRQVKLFGTESVVGRSFMVHADPDDLGKGGHKLSLTTGNAGARIACGEIKLVK